MGAITIEFANKHEEPCACCGGKTTSLTRFVYSDGNAHAVYYARFSDNHPDRYMSAIVSLGEWGDGSKPEDRVAFGLRIREADADFQVMVVNASESPWKHESFLGRLLDRDEALTHPWIKEVFHITDHMVLEDPDVRAYFDGQHAA